MKLQTALRNGTRKTAFAAAGLVAAAAWRSPALADDALGRRVDAVIDRWVEAERIVGTVTLIARNGEIVYRRAAGYADREAGTPASEDTIFRHASLTKAIVCAAALALIDDGRLSLNDTVARWLPYFTPALPDGRKPDITVRQLMTHTSGLSYNIFEPEESAYRSGTVSEGLADTGTTTLEESLRALASLPLAFEPGSQWRYSLSTDVLGAVVEKASGMSLPDAVAHYVTEPLGMADTAFVVTEPARLSAAYLDGDAKAVRMNERGGMLPMGAGVPVHPGRVTDPDAYPSGGAGMSGTAADYLRFLEAIRTGGAPILEERSARAFGKNAIGALRAWTEGEGWGHSLGAAVLLDPEAAGTPQTVGTWQWGGVLGSHWFVDPAEKLTVVVLTNTSLAGVIGEFPAQIREAIYARGED